MLTAAESAQINPATSWRDKASQEGGSHFSLRVSDEHQLPPNMEDAVWSKPDHPASPIALGDHLIQPIEITNTLQYA